MNCLELAEDLVRSWDLKLEEENKLLPPPYLLILMVSTFFQLQSLKLNQSSKTEKKDVSLSCQVNFGLESETFILRWRMIHKEILLHTIGIVSIKKTDSTNVGEDAEQRNLSYTAGIFNLLVTAFI